MLRGRSDFTLPPEYERFAELLSANAQLYLQCSQCDWEQRINVMYGVPASELLSEPCSRCGSAEHRIIRHMDVCDGDCLDCGNRTADLQSVPWQDLACPRCGSHRLELDDAHVAPPYPPEFGEVGDRTPFGWQGNDFMRKDQPWGRDAGSDARHLQREAKHAVHTNPANSSGLMLCEFLFGQSLLGSNVYRDDDANVGQLLSMLSSLLRDCFRQLQDLGMGLQALQYDELAVTVEADPANKAAWEHNVAIMVNSLLTRYPEPVIVEATDRPGIRQEAIEYAGRALRVYESEAADEARRMAAKGDAAAAEPDRPGMTSANQIARTHHLIGDLQRIGDATDADRCAALQSYDEALRWDLPASLLPGLRQSRGETILMLPDATRQELASAWQDLEAALEADTKRLGRSTPWAVLWHMAQIAERLGDSALQLDTLERAAKVAIAAVRQDREEYALEARSAPMAPLFDALTHAYAAAGRPAEALGAAEALRGATVRMHTKTEAARAEDLLRWAEQAGADLARAHMRQAGHAVSLPHALLSDAKAGLDPIEPAVERALERSDTALVSFGSPVWIDGAPTVVAFVCGASGAERFHIQAQTLQPDFAGAEWSPALIRPGPFREARLRRMHRSVSDGLMAPLLPCLDAIGAKRIMFSLPGSLSRYAFEAASLNDGADPLAQYLVQRWEVLYVPAISLALDEVPPPATADPSLLVLGYQGEDLTHAAHEIERLGQLFGKRMTLLSAKACTKLNVLEHLAQPFDYIHFACHGTFDPAIPLQAALHFVPDVTDDSQRLTAADLLGGLELTRHPLITMSACSTALMSSSPVNNCHGLTGSFLRAGARGVVGSRWPVYDAVSAQFMTSLYETILDREHRSPAACVTLVQRALARDHGIEDFASFGYMGRA